VRRAILVLAFGGTLALACRPPHNYVDPDRPIYEGSLGLAPPPRTELRVVTFNIEYALRVPAAIEALRSHPALQAPDVLFLQEMDAPGVEAVARALSLNYVYYPSSVSPKTNRDIGTAVLSPWPIDERSKVVLPHTSRFSGHARSAVAATLRVDGRPIRVYCLHLGTPINLSSQHRRDQLEAVLEDAAQHLGPVIVGGDFNGKVMAERAASRGFAWPTKEVGRTTALFSFDHILVRGLLPRDAASAGVALEVKGVSDHYPVWAVLSLE
jgi:endonuclease/exonuclease/phosphatase family metal-dependent hydrolase